MDTAKLNEISNTAQKVINAVNELLQDAESEGKALVLVEILFSNKLAQNVPVLTPAVTCWWGLRVELVWQD